MKKNTLLVAFTLALLLVGSAWAATAKHGSNMSGSKMSGKIVTVNSSELTLASKVKGKSEQETFVINPQTKTAGTLNPGERATVRYKNENGQKIATMISAHKASSKSGNSK
jgi:hypothetical protein